MKIHSLNIQLFDPPYGSELTQQIMELDNLRHMELAGSTRPELFFQLKEIFQIVESIGSARIEGNRTTVVQFIEHKIEGKKQKGEQIKEIQNVEEALHWIDFHAGKLTIDRAYISELHKIVVKGLSPPPKGEGSNNPGTYRASEVKVTGAIFTPPHPLQVASYMDELIKFINNVDRPQYDLLKVALAHHYFAWIHPFDNGNGRTVRLLTYAMLINLKFRVNIGNTDYGRIINPTAVFCNNRKSYYAALSKADKGTTKGKELWCRYVLKGLSQELHKIDKLLEYDYLKKHILQPAITHASDRRLITDEESLILRMAINNKHQEFMAKDIKKIFPQKNSLSISRIIGKLKEKKMIKPIGDKKRSYCLSFRNGYLLRSVITILDREKFLPIPLDNT